MARFAIEDLSERDITAVFVAGSLEEARLAEELLTVNQVDYAVQVEPYYGPGPFFMSEYRGAAFYVPVGFAVFCRGLLAEHGLKGGLLETETN
jgi:hypothetical protein